MRLTPGNVTTHVEGEHVDMSEDWHWKNGGQTVKQVYRHPHCFAWNTIPTLETIRNRNFWKRAFDFLVVHAEEDNEKYE